ncbi:hypothetical protein [Pelagicoccus sp. SDUM812002]|uniref:hypothetical protein n=1 Tax=Pelagicoccus sp. SDUM812002 TaxID=3041266 RepID=UPI00280F16E4|nr:hypothetical protein [Pelagicoccus sp. SDUM812002]MDQ8188407.1 hypothetical protein [Pelagicoccus sp. SDUM812002]
MSKKSKTRDRPAVSRPIKSIERSDGRLRASQSLLASFDPHSRSAGPALGQFFRSESARTTGSTGPCPSNRCITGVRHPSEVHAAFSP